MRDGVCPTYVGMNREISIVGAVEQRMPHVGGDELRWVY